jgi:uncharacterized iron-regulated membrane protein
MDFYKAVWRWHFYAGLLVLPFMIWLSVTGALFVFKNQIDDWFHADLRLAAPSLQQTALPGSQLIDAALRIQPGTVFRYTGPAQAGRSAEVGILSEGEKHLIYVHPQTAQVLGSLPERGSVAWTIRKLHSLKYFGPVARGLIEIAAGWAILLVLTGLYLWWPRGQSQGVITVRGRPGQRVFWRDLHAVIGFFVSVALLFLALTGMPWSVLWGAKANQLANGHNFGYPAGVRVQIPMSQGKLSDHEKTVWSMEHAQIPLSTSLVTDEHAGHGAAGIDPAHLQPPTMAPAQAIGWDRAIAIFDQAGIQPGYALQPPKGPSGVYSASIYPAELDAQRVIHLDQYSGKVLLDMRYADYGPLGRLMEWGVNVHLGQEFGVLNQILLVLSCLCIILLAVSGAVMWWKRRPSRALGTPPLPHDVGKLKIVTAILAIGALVFPLTGASFVLMAGCDWLLFRTRPN